MNFKVALVAGVIAFSGQTAFAATDTSCNPFVRGESCGGTSNVTSVASVQSAFIRSLRSARSFETLVAAQPAQSQGVGLFLGRLFRDTRTPAIVINDGGDILSVVEEEIVPVDDNGTITDVSAVPVPAAGFLLLAGLGGLVALRRKNS